MLGLAVFLLWLAGALMVFPTVRGILYKDFGDAFKIQNNIPKDIWLWSNDFEGMWKKVIYVRRVSIAAPYVLALGSWMIYFLFHFLYSEKIVPMLTIPPAPTKEEAKKMVADYKVGRRVKK